MRSQYIGIDPRARARCSCSLTSQRNGECSKEREHIGEHDPKRRSAQGNVFNRLGRGADMRDTLNRRREQDHSQQYVTKRVSFEMNSQDVRNILLDDL